jgi:short-subunit dehydrogenase
MQPNPLRHLYRTSMTLQFFNSTILFFMTYKYTTLISCRNFFLFVAVLLVANGCATWKLTSTDAGKLAGKTYVVTGASSGFGKGVSLQLGAAKANVVLAARRVDLLDSVAAEIRSSGGQALVVKTDVSDSADIRNLAEMALEKFGKVDVWINNAGVASIGRFWDIPLEEHSRVIDVNMKGVFYGSYAAIKIFRRQGYGTLINLGSVESEVPVAYQSSYSASKAAVRSLGQVLHQELRLSGDKDINVVTIMPWAARTPFWQHLANHSGGTVTMLALDDPHKIVNAILRASLRPRRQLPVGWKAHAAVKTHRLFPYFTEWLSAQLAHKYQYKHGEPRSPSSGNLFSPATEGSGIYQDRK